jgi:hypothetical protein
VAKKARFPQHFLHLRPFAAIAANGDKTMREKEGVVAFLALANLAFLPGKPRGKLAGEGQSVTVELVWCVNNPR